MYSVETVEFCVRYHNSVHLCYSKCFVNIQNAYTSDLLGRVFFKFSNLLTSTIFSIMPTHLFSSGSDSTRELYDSVNPELKKNKYRNKISNILNRNTKMNTYWECQVIDFFSYTVLPFFLEKLSITFCSATLILLDFCSCESQSN